MRGFAGWSVIGDRTVLDHSSTSPPNDEITLDDLRSLLAHESGSKLGRLSALLERLKRGESSPNDTIVLHAVCRGLRDGWLRVLPIVTGLDVRLGMRLRRLVARFRRIERRIRKRIVHGGNAAEDLQADLAGLQEAVVRLADDVSTRAAADLLGIIRNSVTEVCLERGGFDIVIDDRLGTGAHWLRKDVAYRWRDVLKNLLRNAVDAVIEKDGLEDAPDSHRGQRSRVIVRISQPPVGQGTRLEIEDDGLGMDIDRPESIWRAGIGRHGGHRGQGLTEEKLAFVRSGASYELVSAPGVGTTHILDIAPMVVTLTSHVRRYRIARPIVAAAAVVGAILLVVRIAGIPLTVGPEIAKIRISPHNDHVLEALTPDGDVAWSEALVAPINQNRPKGTVSNPPAMRNTVEGGFESVLVATTKAPPNGMFIILDRRGRRRGEAVMTWAYELPESSAALRSWCQVRLDASELPEAKYVAEVRIGDLSPTSMQFLDDKAQVLGAYYHDGHLKVSECRDFDGDGNDELLLYGINNQGWRDSSIVACEPGTWFGCAILVEPAERIGQATGRPFGNRLVPYPEDVYLMIPPPWCGFQPEANVVSATITTERSGGPERIDLVMDDGRIVSTDMTLYPTAWEAGPSTPAAAAPHMAVFRYRRGEHVENVRIEMKGGAE